MQDGRPAGLRSHELSPESIARVREAASHAANDAALRASERRFRTALSSMVDPVAVVTAVTSASGDILDFVVSYANGRSGTPRVGMLVSALWALKGHESLLGKYRRVLEGGRDLVLD